ncbi:MAG: DUF6527 family protein [Chloroflexota bacterium]|nr:DUF6527 family protein [Chloroflexota bacterium]
MFTSDRPDTFEDEVVYILPRFSFGIHLCCCGCGNQVITPFDPDEWQLMYDGKTISLEPSIGNRSLPCRSHYWIRHNRVRWLPNFSTQKRELSAPARIRRWLLKQFRRLP